jgi:ABC-type Fe3+-hydroxamate transport system substrate-binding protein
MMRRRPLLGGLLASLAPLRLLHAEGFAAASQAGAPSIAALDWGLAETLLSLGIVPVAVPAPSWYDRYVVDPALPGSVVDVGLLFSPNFELLRELSPDLILTTPGLQAAVPMLQRVAPVYSLNLFQAGPDTLAISEQATLALADRIGIRAEGDRLVGETRLVLAASRQQLSGRVNGPVLVASPLDDRHVSLFGANSLYGAVLRAVGLTNAASGIGGEFVIAGLETLGGYADATVVLLETPAAPGMAKRLVSSRLWQTFPFVREGRLHLMAPVLGSGGLPAASRFARLLGEALTGEGSSSP